MPTVKETELTPVQENDLTPVQENDLTPAVQTPTLDQRGLSVLNIRDVGAEKYPVTVSEAPDIVHPSFWKSYGESIKAPFKTLGGYLARGGFPSDEEIAHAHNVWSGKENLNPSDLGPIFGPPAEISNTYDEATRRGEAGQSTRDLWGNALANATIAAVSIGGPKAISRLSKSEMYSSINKALGEGSVDLATDKNAGRGIAREGIVGSPEKVHAAVKGAKGKWTQTKNDMFSSIAGQNKSINGAELFNRLFRKEPPLNVPPKVWDSFKLRLKQKLDQLSENSGYLSPSDLNQLKDSIDLDLKSVGGEATAKKAAEVRTLFDSVIESKLEGYGEVNSHLGDLDLADNILEKRLQEAATKPTLLEHPSRVFRATNIPQSIARAGGMEEQEGLRRGVMPMSVRTGLGAATTPRFNPNLPEHPAPSIPGLSEPDFSGISNAQEFHIDPEMWGSPDSPPISVPPNVVNKAFGDYATYAIRPNTTPLLPPATGEEFIPTGDFVNPQLNRPALPPYSGGDVSPSTGARWGAGREGVMPVGVSPSGASNLPKPVSSPHDEMVDYLLGRAGRAQTENIPRSGTHVDRMLESTSQAGGRIAADRASWATDQEAAKAIEAQSRAAVNTARKVRVAPAAPEVSVGDAASFKKGGKVLKGTVKELVTSKYGPAAVIATPRYGTHTVLLSDLNNGANTFRDRDSDNSDIKYSYDHSEPVAGRPKGFTTADVTPENDFAKTVKVETSKWAGKRANGRKRWVAAHHENDNFSDIPIWKLLPSKFEKITSSIRAGSPRSGWLPGSHVLRGEYNEAFPEEFPASAEPVHNLDQRMKAWDRDENKLRNVVQTNRYGSNELSTTVHEYIHAIYRKGLTPKQRSGWNNICADYVEKIPEDEYEPEDMPKGWNPGPARASTLEDIPKAILDYPSHEAFTYLATSYVLDPSELKRRYPDIYDYMNSVFGQEYIQSPKKISKPPIK